MKRLRRTFYPTNTPDSKEIYIKKLHSFYFYALVTTVITLGVGTVLAQQSTGQDIDSEQQCTQCDQDATRSTPRAMENGQGTQLAMLSDSQIAVDHRNTLDLSLMQHRGYMDSAPANRMQVSDLLIDMTLNEDLRAAPESPELPEFRTRD